MVAQSYLIQLNRTIGVQQGNWKGEDEDDDENERGKRTSGTAGTKGVAGGSSAVGRRNLGGIKMGEKPCKLNKIEVN